MKKIVAVVALSAILLTGNVAFAEGATSPGTRAAATQAVANYRAHLAEIQPLLQTIRSNRTEILRLRADARASYAKAKATVKELRQNKENLTLDQLESLKESLNIIRQDRQSLGSTSGDIARELPNLRASRQTKNVQGVEAALNNIISVQSTRINDLNKIIVDLNKVAAM